MIKVLHTIAGIWKHTGGPAESVPRLCSELSKVGNKITLATLDGPLSKAALASREEGVELVTFPRLPGDFSPAFAKLLPDICKVSDIVHGHGLWMHVNWSTGKHAKGLNKPLVITPRGSLEPRRLKHSYWKKRVSSFLFDKSNLEYASCIHATSEMEYESIRSYGIKNPVAIIQNGVDVPTFNSDKQHLDSFREKYPEFKNKRIMLFLSRLSWEKGLPLLVKAWKSLSSDFKDWHLVIAGQGTTDYEKEIKSLFCSNGLAERTTWTGILHDEEKRAAFSEAELFVLPTLSENFGIAVAEALASGIPVITTHGAPWKVLLEERCGWWIPVDVSDLAEAMREAMSLSDVERMRMGERGKFLMKDKYSWQEVALKMVKVYKWVLQGGKIPEFMKLD